MQKSVQPASSAATASARLLDVLSHYDSVTVVMHDNPDPDAIATAWCVACLVECRLGLPTHIVASGGIVRAENKYLVDVLNPPIELTDKLEIVDNTAIILVDCGATKTNHLVARCDAEPTAVIDHHVTYDRNELLFHDTRVDAAASVSIAASYLQEQQIDPGVSLATAIVYAIRTETCGAETGHSKLDRSVIEWLTPLADLEVLADISSAPLDPEYYCDLVLALQSTFIHGDAAICFLPQADGAEIIGEVADLVVRRNGIRRVLCAAMIGDDLLLSVRTSKDGGNAAQLLRQTLGDLGGCGGHMHRAGGKVLIARGNGRRAVTEAIHKRWIKRCGVADRRGRRLVPRQDIIENL